MRLGITLLLATRQRISRTMLLSVSVAAQLYLWLDQLLTMGPDRQEHCHRHHWVGLATGCQEISEIEDNSKVCFQLLNSCAYHICLCVINNILPIVIHLNAINEPVPQVLHSRASQRKMKVSKTSMLK